VEFVCDAQNPVNGRFNLMEIAIGFPEQFELRAVYLSPTLVQSLDSLGRSRVPNLHNVIDMVAESDEKVKEKFTATFHFCLHGAAPLKCLATSYN
jgi:hypothetical protein